MSFVIKTRGAGGFLVAEYRCPEHGVFAVTVQRDVNGDAPDEMPCPQPDDSDRYEWRETECGTSSPWTVSAPLGRVKQGEVGRGKYEPPPTKAYTDTRELGEGMPMAEWQAKRDAMWEERRIKEVREESK